MEFTPEQMMQLFQMFITSLHQSTPVAPPKPAVPATNDPLGPDKVGVDGMATSVEARGPSPGPGYMWLRGQDPSGRWREMWQYVGVQHATGVGIQPGESPMQYAQRMGVPNALLPTMTSVEAVDAYLRNR